MSRRGLRTRQRQQAKRWGGLLVAAILGLAAVWWQGHPDAPSPPQGDAPHGTAAALPRTARPESLPDFLPKQALQTLALIARGGPYPHPQDGSVFGNDEGHLPAQRYGWYHAFTVDTPGLPPRGTRRIITGGTPPRTYWDTDDHYASFHAFKVSPP